MTLLSQDFRQKLRILGVALLLGATAPAALAWWNEAWTVRTRVKLDTTAAGVATQAPVNNFMLAVRLHSGNFDFVRAKEDGSDLRLVAGDDKTALRFRIERFDAVNELALLWVQVPLLLPASDKNRVYVYAGNKAATAEAPFAEDGNLATFSLSTRDGMDLSGKLRAREPITPERNALLGGGARLAGQAIAWPAGPQTQAAAGSALTWSLWARPDSAAGTLLQQGPLSLGWRAGKLETRIGNKAVPGGDVAPGTWSHIALVLDQGRATIYVNGTPGNAGDLVLPALNAELSAGRDFNGQIDQIEISSSARSADALRLMAASQGIDSRLASSVKEDPSTAAGDGGGSQGGYFGILFANLTVDAWIIIIILGVMFVIAVWVMWTKTLMVMRADRANRSFLLRFRQAKDNVLAVVGGADSPNPHSTLQRVYESGVRELVKRDAGNGGPGLSGASIDAVKAAVDADLVRETHRLNDRIVLLTIAIAGGPFLGLLGTVVGVMITFAAIAAAGDVNVNAIAPGIAAALLATVAGLAVAIPALFGYNWLAARIKNITSDMQIFADEFIARVAELYGRP